jgi:hypothetical protein
MFARGDSLGLTLAKQGLGDLQALRGNFAEARRLMAIAPKANPAVCGGTGPDQYDALYAGTVGGDAAAQAHATRMVDACLAEGQAETPAWTVASLMRLKDFPRALGVFASRKTTDDAGIGFRVWGPEFTPMRRLPQFSEAASRIGWVDAWEKYGPPDACKRTAPRQYQCE